MKTPKNHAPLFDKDPFPVMILISPTAFKGTLSPWEAAQCMAQAVRENSIRSKISLLPLADGGDGTLEVLLRPLKGQLMKTSVRGPLGQKTTAKWGWVPRQKLAILEMAEASGLKLVKGKNKILDATSFGAGQLIQAALKKKCRTILMGVGGTATSDGGAGALQALGLRYLDHRGNILSAEPRDLIHLARLDWSHLDSRLSQTKIVVLCDVKNPLLGQHGSARTFGPQKGASPAQVEFLETGLRHWSRFSKYKTSRSAGAGAAGAMAFGLSGFLGAQLVDGCSFIMKSLKWEKKCRQASLIFTGEGRLDQPSFQGKVIGAICRRKKGKVAVACGSTSLTKKYLNSKGIVDFEQMGKQGLRKPAVSLSQATTRLIGRLLPV